MFVAFLLNTFCFLFINIFSSIVIENIRDIRYNTIDVRFIINATDENDIQDNEIRLLEKFANMPATIAIIICNNQNIDFMKKKISNLKNSDSIVRYYNNVPMILNTSAHNMLPKLNAHNEKLSAFTVVVVDVDQDLNSETHDYRILCMKNHKSYVQNPGGAIEDSDFQDAGSYEVVLKNTAYREICEDLNVSFSVILPEQLNPIGIFKFTEEKNLIDVRWQNIFAAFYCCLGKIGTKILLDKMEIQTVANQLVCGQKIKNNDEARWLFFVKPDIFQEIEVNFFVEDGKVLPLETLHSDVAAVVLKQIFHFDNVHIGRANSYFDRELTYSNLQPLFSDSFLYLRKSGDFDMNFE